MWQEAALAQDHPQAGEPVEVEEEETMFARVSTYAASPADVDRLVEAFDSDDRLSRMAGIRDAFLLVDRPSGRALTVTLWETEEVMAASAAGASQVREDAASSGGGSIQSVETYEVALHLADVAV
jgi:heme-degrading monooxygenase HmoA